MRFSFRVLALLMMCLAGGCAIASVLQALAPDAIVVVGDQASPVERDAATQLAKALQAAGGPADNVRLASIVNTDLELAASHHLLVVGTEASNRVMGRFPSHWAMNRDTYYTEHKPYDDFVPTKGFALAGYGVFSSGNIGYLECDRNPYWHYAASLVGLDPQKPALPYRQIIRFYGNSPGGVAASVKAFLTRHILNGPVVAGDRMPEPLSLWSIDTAHFASPESAPSWINTTEVTADGQKLAFLGWHIADAMAYSGFLEVSGQAALKIWRAKYHTEKGWNYPMNAVTDPAHSMTISPMFEATLQRRASGNELLVAQMSTPQQATQTEQSLENYLNGLKNRSHAPWTDITVNGINWRQSRHGLCMATIDAYLVMANFDKDHGSLALRLVGPVRR